MNRPPMERTPAIAALFQQAREIGRGLGLELSEGSTGGGSDGNFTAALGVPTLDGLGARGGGAHADDEHVLIDSLPERAGLLAALAPLLTAGMITAMSTEPSLKVDDQITIRRADRDRRLSRLPGRPAEGLGHQRRRLPGPRRDDGRRQPARGPGSGCVSAGRRGRGDVVRLPRPGRRPASAFTRN